MMEKTMKILIVDDEEIPREIIRNILQEYGTCTCTHNAFDAIAKLKEAYQKGEPYTLLTLDIEMPSMNGHEVLKHLRDFETKQGIKLAQGCKVIMITVHKESNNVFPAFKSGCEAYLVKPIEPDKIKSTLKDLKLIG